MARRRFTWGVIAPRVLPGPQPAGAASGSAAGAPPHPASTSLTGRGGRPQADRRVHGLEQQPSVVGRGARPHRADEWVELVPSHLAHASIEGFVHPSPGLHRALERVPEAIRTCPVVPDPSEVRTVSGSLAALKVGL